MGAVAMTARAELRRHRGATLALALAVALGLGAALGAFIVAHRTQRAYPEHIAAARVSDLVVNPSFGTRRGRTRAPAPPARASGHDVGSDVRGGLVDPSMRTIGDAIGVHGPG